MSSARMNRTLGRREDVDCPTPLAEINASLLHVAARNSRRVTVGTIGTIFSRCVSMPSSVEKALERASETPKARDATPALELGAAFFLNQAKARTLICPPAG